MYIEELVVGKVESVGEESLRAEGVVDSSNIAASDAKRVLIGAGARALFYPTLLYNVVRNKMQAEFRWWDKVDEVLLNLLVNLIVLYFVSFGILCFRRIVIWIFVML